MGGLVYRTADGRVPSDMFVPVAGPYMALAQKQLPFDTLLLADPIVQGFGLVATGAAAIVPGEPSRSHSSSPSNAQWSVAPAWNAGPGVSLSVTSW